MTMTNNSAIGGIFYREKFWQGQLLIHFLKGNVSCSGIFFVYIGAICGVQWYLRPESIKHVRKFGSTGFRRVRNMLLMCDLYFCFKLDVF